MSDAITELRRLRGYIEHFTGSESWGPASVVGYIDARISALGASQQDEPSRGDAKLREAARWICERAIETWTDTAPSAKVVAINPSDLAALRAAMGES